jgi:hypothetical protein
MVLPSTPQPGVSRSVVLHLRYPAGWGGPGNPLPVTVAEFCSGTTPSWWSRPDGLYLDLTGSERLWGRGTDGPAAICRRARQVLPVIAAGAGPTSLSARLAAEVAGRSGPGGVFVVAPGSARAFLTAFPVEVLREHRSQARRLRALGVRTLGDLQTVPLDLLRALFGEGAHALAAEAMGLQAAEDRRGTERLPLSTLVVGALCRRPLDSPAAVRALLDGLALRALLACPGGPGSRQSWLLGAEFPGQVRHRAWGRSTGSGSLEDWRRLLALLFGRLPRSRLGLRRLELRAGQQSPQSHQQGELFPDDQRGRNLSLALRRLQARGAPPVRRASEDLLQNWDVRWYGPGAPNHSPTVDAGPRGK